jgi:hypothetical protein
VIASLAKLCPATIALASRVSGWHRLRRDAHHSMAHCQSIRVALDKRGSVADAVRRRHHPSLFAPTALRRIVPIANCWCGGNQGLSDALLPVVNSPQRKAVSATELLAANRDAFAVLTVPIDIARVHAAVDCAWTTLQSRSVVNAGAEFARANLYRIVASNIPFGADHHQLIRRPVDHFRTGWRQSV